MNTDDVSNDHVAVQPISAAAQESVRRVEELKLDPFELGLLAVCRQFLAAFDAPELHAWQHAYEIAIQRWGETVGFPAAHGLLNLLKTLLRRRPDGFAFQDPLCVEKRLIATADEAALMRMIHFMRRDQTPQARECMEALLLGRRDVDVIHAGLSFAARFPAGVEGTQASRSTPKFCVVD